MELDVPGVPGAWGAVLLLDPAGPHSDLQEVGWDAGLLPKATAVRSEYLAAIEGLKVGALASCLMRAATPPWRAPIQLGHAERLQSPPLRRVRMYRMPLSSSTKPWLWWDRAPCPHPLPPATAMQMANKCGAKRVRIFGHSDLFVQQVR